MTGKIKKRLLVVFLIMSYCAGLLFAPISALESDGFDELLAERNNSDTAQEEKVTKKIHVSDFTDVKKNDWFYGYLDYLVENGIVNGKTETTFEPSGTFSYAECSAVIVRYLGLEQEAEKRRAELVKRLPETKNMWYAGYFDVLKELGLFSDYGLFETKNGKIVSIDVKAADSPVVRYRFAESITESFELDPKELRANNVYEEIGGRGMEFIIGGMYDKALVARYEMFIADFDEIPQNSREKVLKAYYNGIFNGDAEGRFNPNNNLTRAEMAKVLATIKDFSLRTRLITEGYGEAVEKNMLHTDFDGVKTVKFGTWKKLLEEQAKNVTATSRSIEYTKGNAPFGYAFDAYLYEKKGDEFVLSVESTLHDGNADSLSIKKNDARILIVLRNVAQNLRVEGVMDILIEDGEIISSKPLVYEMPPPEEPEEIEEENEEESTDVGSLYL